MNANVINFPTSPESMDANQDELNEENQAPLTAAPVMDHRALANMIDQTRKLVGIFQSSWDNAKAEFGIDEAQISELIKYNTSARVDKTDDQSDEEYDDLNGLNAIPMERVADIFGVGSKIFGVDPSQTLDRVRYVANVFTELYKAHRELRMIDEQFAMMMNENEQLTIRELQAVLDDETADADKKADAQKAIDRYWYVKHVAFLLDLDDKAQEHLIKCFTDPNRIRYMIERGRKMMERHKLPGTFILEISSFEKRFMDKKYHHQNNLLLLAYLQKIAFLKLPEDQQLLAELHGMMLGMDGIVRHEFSDELAGNIMTSLIAFHEMFLGRILDLSESGSSAE